MVFILMILLLLLYYIIERTGKISPRFLEICPPELPKFNFLIKLCLYQRTFFYLLAIYCSVFLTIENQKVRKIIGPKSQKSARYYHRNLRGILMG